MSVATAFMWASFLPLAPSTLYSPSRRKVLHQGVARCIWLMKLGGEYDATMAIPTCEQLMSYVQQHDET